VGRGEGVGTGVGGRTKVTPSIGAAWVVWWGLIAYSALLLSTWEREGSMGCRNQVTDRWVLPANSNKFKIPNFIQTWFTPKVIFPSSKNLNKNTGR
jgi:hypothetical protein